MISLTSDGIYLPMIKLRQNPDAEINPKADMDDLRENLFAVLRDFPAAHAAILKMLEEKIEARDAARRLNR